MRTMNGGYAMINLASATIYADAVAALASNKPIVVYEATGAPYYADSVTTSGTSVVITKGGKTITIANDNTITNVGDIQTKLYTYEFEIAGEDTNTVAHEIRFIFNSTKKLTKDNIINYFNNFNHSYDWAYSGEDFETNHIVIVNDINTNSLNARDFEDNSDINFDLTNEDIEISLYLINEE